MYISGHEVNNYLGYVVFLVFLTKLGICCLGQPHKHEVDFLFLFLFWPGQLFLDRRECFGTIWVASEFCSSCFLPENLLQSLSTQRNRGSRTEQLHNPFVSQELTKTSSHLILIWLGQWLIWNCWYSIYFLSYYTWNASIEQFVACREEGVR